VLWANQSGPIVAYWDPAQAWTHARTMLGVNVAQVEVRDELPDIVRDDLQSEWESDSENDTPIELEELDDFDPPKSKKT
jgi:hypothetical protein